MVHKRGVIMAKARRDCPQCNMKDIHVRTRVCKGCGHEFYPQKNAKQTKPEQVQHVPPTPTNKPGKGKGRKVCPDCNVPTGVRSKVCPDPSCGHKFIFTPKPKNPLKTETIIDWKSLQKGDTLKVIQGHGPVWIDQEGEEHHVGHHGIFSVVKRQEDGLMCHGGIKGNSGTAFIYLGEEKQLDSGTILRPHRIQLVKNK